MESMFDSLSQHNFVTLNHTRLLSFGNWSEIGSHDGGELFVKAMSK